MSEEAIFSLGGEGGSITIYKEQEGNTEIFVYYDGEPEVNDDDEDITIRKKVICNTFEEAFAFIDKYPWHFLIITVLDQNYRKYVLEQLINRLNNEKITPENLHNRERLEKRLSIKLSCSVSERNSSPMWSYEITNPDSFKSGFYF